MTDSIVRWHMMLYSFVMMRTRLTLAPGKKGAKKLLAQYGDQLVCVRYRYDAQKRRRYKTVELILAEREWEPTDPDPADEVKVNLTIDARELALRQAVKQAGGLWKPGERVWELRYDRAIALDLEDRVVR